MKKKMKIPPKDKKTIVMFTLLCITIFLSVTLGMAVQQTQIANAMQENNIIFCDKDTGRSLAYEDNVKETILIIPNNSGILPLEVN